jgi:hypothetical protein
MSFQQAFPDNNLSAYYFAAHPWEYELLRHSHMTSSVSEFVLSMSSANCIGMSDGSVNNYEGAYGWIFATQSGSQLDTGSGRIPTNPCSSYRAESYGMLSLLRFLYHVTVNIAAPNITALQISTDSNSLIQKVTQYLQFDTFYPNTTLEPDWDVLQIICTTIKCPSQLNSFT